VSNNNLEYNNLIIFPGLCKENVDPKGLGRIRAVDKTSNESARISSINDEEKLQDVSEKKKWTDEDNFVFRPLLPWFINQIPKENEYVHLFYSNLNEKGGKNKYYIGGVFSSPTYAGGEPYDGAKQITDLGSQIKESIDIFNKKTGNYADNTQKRNGIYGAPSNIVINGRGSADIVIADDSLQLRAGKFNSDLKPGMLPLGNGERAFLQLSEYQTKTTFQPGQRFYRLNSEHKDINILVEYTVDYPTGNQGQNYNGSVRFYRLQPTNPYANTEKMDLNSPIKTSEMTPVLVVTFGPYSEEKVYNVINDILKGFAEGDLSNLLSNEDYPNLNFDKTNINQIIPRNDVFPFYFRPQPDLYGKVRPENTNATIAQKLFVTRLMSNIKLVDGDLTSGYGLAYDIDKNNNIQQFVPEKFEKEDVIPQTTENISNTAGILGSDVLYLLSHKSQKNGTGKIDFANTLSGITETFLTNQIEPKTSSTVRGEELIELLNLIVRFLLNHVHPYHGMPPDSQTLDNVRADELYEELRNAQEKILNKYIRIN